MPLVNRLLDAFFRTLDAVDIARERIDRALGRAPRPEPWTSEWSPVPDAPSSSSSSSSSPVPSTFSAPAPVVRAPAPARKQAQAPAAKKKTTKAIAAKKGSGGNRKGSVDRSGKDFDSPRAKAIVERLKEQKLGVIAEDADLNGKRVLARVLWALDAADKAGSELGLTAADASALLHLAGGMEVFATNVARTCRDETALISESSPDGRSKRYKITDAGRQAAAKIATRAM